MLGCSVNDKFDNEAEAAIVEDVVGEGIGDDTVELEDNVDEVGASVNPEGPTVEVAEVLDMMASTVCARLC